MSHTRLTKIVCTLGPSSESKEQILALAEAGMNVARINMSHGNAESYAKAIAIIREINAEGEHNISIMLDTKGPEIRTGVVEKPIVVAKGDNLLFCPPGSPKPTEGDFIEVNYDGFTRDVRETDSVLIDNGELAFDLVKVNQDGTVICRARQGGKIGSRRHVNLPGADIDLPSITEKDWEDIAFAAEYDVDFIALSFIRAPEDVERVRTYFSSKNAHVRLITKVETLQASKCIAQLIDVSDGIMVARGDLGAEVPFELLPVMQDDMVNRCIDSGKPVIVATHMLESMTESPIPTRAEMTDVSHAAVTMTDATMLSGETAGGIHPPLVVESMHRLLCATEEHMASYMDRKTIGIRNDQEAKAEAAVNLAGTTQADAIVVFTRSGDTAQFTSKFRPRMPIVACTDSDRAMRRMTLMYGVYPVLVSEFAANEETVQKGLEAAKKSGRLRAGQHIVLISNISADEGDVWSIQTRDVR